MKGITNDVPCFFLVHAVRWVDDVKAADGALIIVALGMLWTLYRAHKNPLLTFDMFDLIMENGRVSKYAFAFMLTLGATTWIMIRLVIDGKMTEGYFGLYGALWITPLVAKMFNAQPSTLTETSVTTSTKVTP